MKGIMLECYGAGVSQRVYGGIIEIKILKISDITRPFIDRFWINWARYIIAPFLCCTFVPFCALAPLTRAAPYLLVTPFLLRSRPQSTLLSLRVSVCVKVRKGAVSPAAAPFVASYKPVLASMQSSLLQLGIERDNQNNIRIHLPSRGNCTS